MMFVLRRVKQYELVLHGITLKDKIKLLILAVFYTLPNKITNMNAKTPQLMIDVSKNTRVKSEGVIYKLSHPRQLFMISDQFERNIQYWFNLSGETFLDIGANIGKYSIKLSDRFKNVHAFEPTPETFSMLKHNVEENKIKNIHLHQIAAWNTDTDLTFHLKNNPGGNSASMEENSVGTLTVVAEKLDNYIDTFGKVDLVKIDVEGAELEVLEGMSRIINECSPIIIVEVLEKNRFSLYRFMDQHDYGLIKTQNRNHLFYPTCIDLGA